MADVQAAGQRPATDQRADVDPLGVLQHRRGRQVRPGLLALLGQERFLEGQRAATLAAGVSPAVSQSLAHPMALELFCFGLLNGAENGLLVRATAADDGHLLPTLARASVTNALADVAACE